MSAASKACQQPINGPPQIKVHIGGGESSERSESGLCVRVARAARHIGGREE
jgi:hypothetical protein